MIPISYLINLYAKDGKIDDEAEKKAFSDDMKAVIAEIYGQESTIYKGLEERLNNSVFDFGKKDYIGQYSLERINGNTLTSKIEIDESILKEGGAQSSKIPTEQEIKTRKYFVAGILVHELEHAQQIEKDYKQIRSELERHEDFNIDEFNKMYKYMFDNIDGAENKKFVEEALINTGIVTEQEIKQKPNSGKILLYNELLKKYNELNNVISAELSAYKVQNTFLKKTEDLKKTDPTFNKEYFDKFITGSRYISKLNELGKSQPPENVDKAFITSLFKTYMHNENYPNPLMYKDLEDN